MFLKSTSDLSQFAGKSVILFHSLDPLHGKQTVDALCEIIRGSITTMDPKPTYVQLAESRSLSGAMLDGFGDGTLRLTEYLPPV